MTCIHPPEFTLSEHYFVTVCLYQNDIRLDIGQFFNRKPTIKEVYLTMKQLDFFKKLLPHLHKEIINAR